MAHVLELRGLTKRYPGHTALEDLTLDVREGEFFSLLGPSGCGKTTTLRLVAGFEQATRGEVLLRGRRIDHLAPFERNVSTVFQNYALFPHLTVEENIRFGLRYRKQGEAKVPEVMEMLQIASKRERKPAALSGGEKQRVALARALVLHPALVLCDEPTGSLDQAAADIVSALLLEMHRRHRTILIVATHNLDLAERMGTRYKLTDGRLQVR